MYRYYNILYQTCLISIQRQTHLCYILYGEIFEVFSSTDLHHCGVQYFDNCVYWKG